MNFVPVPALPLNFDFAVEQIQVGAHNVQPTPRPASSVFIGAVEKPGWKKHFA